MKRHLMSAAILLLCGLNAVAQGNDSIKNIFLKEFVLTAQDESDRKIKTNNYAGSTTILTNKELNNERINAVKDISLTVPNFYIPDYGSKTTSSIYSRGISTRMNEPSVGLYVDGIPVMNKSLYDFELFNIANIDVALGPQGTLYGRNSISGIIDINTIDESTFDGSIKSSFTTGYGSYNTFKERLTIQGGDKTFGVSASGHYDKSDGYFENEYNGEMNKSESAGGRLNLFWNLPYDWKIKLNGTFDHSAQNAYPYADYTTGKISYDGDGYYRRDFVMSGLTIDKKIGKHKITSATGYQYLDDNMT
ncbi:MAG: TonB-dependent receptor plug domain-containing protein, partial [Paludibacteraceae bacterium]|nr:TonB-dependent receptor plug domain-containing protein [Paludibacteraceae bacterium]